MSEDTEARDRILVVDDEELNRVLLEDFLEEQFDVDTAANGREALDCIEEVGRGYAAILCDLQMPVMSGLELLSNLAKMGISEYVPVIVLTSEGERGVETQCLRLGATDFIRKPFDYPVIERRLRNSVELFRYQHSLEERVQQQTCALREQNSLLARQASLLRMQADRLRATNQQIIEVLGDVVEFRDLESGKHINRVKQFVKVLAERVMLDNPETGLDEKMVEIIVNASPLHDVGKIAIPDAILLKPGKLTPEEFEKVKVHTTYGYDMLEGLESVWGEDYYKVSRDICRWHHEKYDGKGYPDGLKGDEIPLSAQLVSLADVFDALVSERVYKEPYSIDEAFEMIHNGECGAFSPMLLRAFDDVREEYEAIATLKEDGEVPEYLLPVAMGSFGPHDVAGMDLDPGVLGSLPVD